MSEYIPIPAPEDTVSVEYDLYSRERIFNILEAGGWTFIVQPTNRRVLTSQAAAERLMEVY